MMKQLPKLKYRIAAFLVINPLLALTAGAVPIEAQAIALDLFQYGADSIQQFLGLFQNRSLAMVR